MGPHGGREERAWRRRRPRGACGDDPGGRRRARGSLPLAYLACQHVVAAACGANTDEAVAEDAAQEALLRIPNHLEAFRRECRFTTWVYRIVVNVLADEMRRRTWRHQPLEEARIPTAPPAAPETLAERHATWAVIQDAIAQDLTPRQQYVVVARIVHQELLIVRADELGTSKDAT